MCCGGVCWYVRGEMMHVRGGGRHVKCEVRPVMGCGGVRCWWKVMAQDGDEGW